VTVPVLRWFATPSVGAPYLRHLLPDDVVAQVDAGRREWPFGFDGLPALCGERRLKWWPVEEFARPDAFEDCPRCASVSRGTVTE
jgi:hypothetical protein